MSVPSPPISLSAPFPPCSRSSRKLPRSVSLPTLPMSTRLALDPCMTRPISVSGVSIANDSRVTPPRCVHRPSSANVTWAHCLLAPVSSAR
ncbi:hypothetical protein C7I84_27605 [Mesorhizobium ephedrae]|uniref:Uncharacterized protein n=1 Tax=Kumtagia ephedrae TaxID=2116701 RepID=A0A2P7RMF6_9HYPH|nr:hypothetical protein C7I84_27605 [Mesorhizobium ephedrae]